MPVGIDIDAVVVARILFWALLPVVLCARRDWAVLALLSMTNLDATGPGVASNGNMGWINATKGLVLPLIVAWRFRDCKSELLRTPAVILWILLIVYAALASLWSSYPLAAAKLVANMAGILAMVVLLEKYARCGLLDATVSARFILITLALGVCQTLAFGGQAFGFAGYNEPVRFTSFVSAQQYAALLVAMLTLVLWLQAGLLGRTVLASAVLAALVLNGSRTWFLGAMVAVAIFGWLSFRRVAAYATVGISSLALAILLVVNMPQLASGLHWGANTRLGTTAFAVLFGEDNAGVAGLGTFNFRMSMYRGLIDELHAADLSSIVFGHGTSTGGDVALRVFPQSYRLEWLDPNRTIHNEWLRVQYEWGLMGLILWGGSLLFLVLGAVASHRDGVNRRGAAALLCYLPALFLALTTENVIAGAGNAVTTGFSLLVAFLYARPREGK